MPAYEETLKRRRAKLGSAHPDTLHILEELGQAYRDAGRLDESATLLRKALDARKKRKPGHGLTFNTMLLLGTTLLEQKKYADAEPLLVQGYEGIKMQTDQYIPPWNKVLPIQALERIVRLYEATGQPDQAEKWRGELRAAAKAKKQ